MQNTAASWCDKGPGGGPMFSSFPASFSRSIRLRDMRLPRPRDPSSPIDRRGRDPRPRRGRRPAAAIPASDAAITPSEGCGALQLRHRSEISNDYAPDPERRSGQTFLPALDALLSPAPHRTARGRGHPPSETGILFCSCGHRALRPGGIALQAVGESVVPAPGGSRRPDAGPGCPLTPAARPT